MGSIRMTELNLPRLHQFVAFNGDLVQQLLIIRIEELAGLHYGPQVTEDLLLGRHCEYDAFNWDSDSLCQVLNEKTQLQSGRRKPS